MSDIISFTNRFKLNTFTLDDLILQIQNISLFYISTYSFYYYCIYYNSYQLTNNVEEERMKSFNSLMPFIGVHASCDLFFTKTIDMKMHHIFVLGIMFYNYYTNVSLEHRFLFLYPLVKTEISSIFYVLKFWLPKTNPIYILNSLIFYATFFKFRMCDFYLEIVQNIYTFDMIIQKYSNGKTALSAMLLISMNGLFLLNIYWFLIINKILFKGISKIINININTPTICHYVCAYLHWINIPLAAYIYSYNKNEKYILDVVGITSLSITSYLYHYDIYYKLCMKKLDEYISPDKNNIVLYFNDNLFIQIRSFLTIATSYYNSPYYLHLIFISGLIHAASSYNIVLNSFELLTDDTIKPHFITINNVITSLPICVDVILIIANSKNEIAIPFLLVNVIMALLLKVEPFYHLTHIGIHILLIIHNYYLCMSHSNI